jgi:hypothetical protein
VVSVSSTGSFVEVREGVTIRLSPAHRDLSRTMHSVVCGHE